MQSEMAIMIRISIYALCLWTVCEYSFPRYSDANDNFRTINSLNSKAAGIERAYLARRLLKNCSWQGLEAFKNSEDLDLSLAASWRNLELQVVAAGSTAKSEIKRLPSSELKSYLQEIKRRMGVDPPEEWARRLKQMSFSRKSGLTILQQSGLVTNDATEKHNEHRYLAKSGKRWRLLDTHSKEQLCVSVHTNRPTRQRKDINVSDEVSTLLDALSGIRTYSLPYLVAGKDFGAILAFDHRHNTLIVEPVYDQPGREWSTSMALPHRLVGLGQSPVETSGLAKDGKLYVFAACYSSVGIIILDAATGRVRNLFWSAGPSD